MNTFNLKRFWNYAKRDFYYSKNWYLGIIGFIALLLTFGIIFNNFNYERISDMIMNTAIIVPTIFFFIAPFLMEEKRYKKQAIFSNILPVSNFEKYLTFSLKYVVFLPLLLWGMGFLMVDIYNFFTDRSAALFSLCKEDYLNRNFQILYIYIIMGFHSLCLLGYYFFKKNALVKTAVSLSAIYITLSIIILIAGKIFTVDVSNVHFIEYFRPTSVYHWLGVSAPLFANVILYIFRIIFPFGIWFATYFKMKEIEI